MSHPAQVYNTLDQLLADAADGINKPKYTRYWTRKWNTWRVRHPGKPFIIKCSVCSGQEQKLLRKHGKWKDSKPRRTVDD